MLQTVSPKAKDNLPQQVPIIGYFWQDLVVSYIIPNLFHLNNEKNAQQIYIVLVIFLSCFVALIYVTVGMWFFETSSTEGMRGQESTTGLKKIQGYNMMVQLENRNIQHNVWVGKSECAIL